MSRGVDLDVIALSPAPDETALRLAIDGALKDAGCAKLGSIEEIRLDLLNEWLMPGERCVAITEVRNGWQFLYDTDFSVSSLSDAVARALPETLLLHFNLQEETDFTLRILRGNRVIQEYSNEPASFNWGRCLGKSEALNLARHDAALIAETAGKPDLAAAIDAHFAVIRSKQKGERVGSGPRSRYKGGAQDAVQSLAKDLGMPRLYRFFEGWMKSDLDWDEDEVQTVLAYRSEKS
jgi:hypothetical protein